MHTNTSTPTIHHVTESSFDSNEFNQPDATMSDLINITNNPNESNTEFNQTKQISKPFHLFPYRRHQSIGLISRTRSAPLSLATGYSTNYRHIQLQNLNNVHNLSNSMNTPTSVTSAANILAMEAATTNFGNQQQTNGLNSNQSMIENDQLGVQSNNLQSSVDNELSSRSKVVLQLRKKILERSEFLTSDRSGVNNLDGSNSPNSRINQTTGRINPLLERTASSPVVNMAPTIRSETVPEATFTTVLAYDLGMLAHHCTCQTDANHPENPQRLISIWQRLQQTGLAAKCHHQPGRRASLIELQLVHKDVYTVLFGSNPASRCRIDPTLLATVRLCRLACGGVGVDSDTAWHTAGHTAHAARLAAGCVVDLACRVMLGQCPNGFALVRPPGHHAEPGQAMGFCYFNSVAIAAKRAQFLGSTTLGTGQSSVISSSATTLFDQSTFLPYTIESALKPRILIVDWDIHHGNGTQTVFYTDPTVLYISLHRHDEGGFFPGTGSPEEIGSGPGEGYTINIAWPSGIVMSDAEYLAAFRLIILPVACEFQPSIVLISAGFDAAPGHSANLGGYSVSPAAFGWMTRLLSIDRIANSKVVLSLEGGYDMNSLCDCTEACVRALLRSAAEINERNSIPISVPDLIPLKQSELDRVPHPSAIQTLLKVAHLHSVYWTSFSNEIGTQYASMPASSWLPTIFDNSSIEIKDLSSTTEHISVVSTNVTPLSANKRFLKSLIKQTPLTTDLNVLTSGNVTENNRYYNFVMRQASSMDETNETEMKPNSIRRRSTTGITPSNMDSITSINDTNETITRIALTRLAELHVTSQPE
ncbi:putative histone deacetylase 4, 5 [Schistosoma mansoni]|uniref:putative histone deacetylase 4, 5 n=1 Tax=Schistosoma mansoni TaxID=6183 RepID=UPI00022DC55A|nr:putative histone deacetylase 4, 5 [Schistosoma mansoni]|eukprot:XP_018650639.1 putative histone deacetylase 4, 5 [Schistosoma mansoni]